MKAPFVQCYFEGRPVFVPLFPTDDAWLPPIVKAGGVAMLELRNGKFNVDTVVFVNPQLSISRVYSIVVNPEGIMLKMCNNQPLQLKG